MFYENTPLKDESVNLIIGILIAIIFVVTAILITLYLVRRNQRFEEFVILHSKGYKDLLERNKRYKFHNIDLKYKELKMSYDSEVNFDNIEPYDVLIATLDMYQEDILNVINKIEENKSLYKKYIDEGNIYKEFDTLEGIKNTEIEALYKIEIKLIEKESLKPTIKYEQKVIVTYEKIDDEGDTVIFNKKEDTFSKEEVYRYIELLNEKRGNFYLNEDIFESLTRFERAKVSNKIRFEVFERDNYTCKKCGKRNPGNLEIDHIKPISKGGKTKMDNLQTLCRECNKEKGNQEIRY